MSILNYLMILSNSVKLKLKEKLQPLTGVSKLLPSDVSSSTNGVIEASVIVDIDNVKIYFTRANGDIDNVVCVATASDINDTWVVDNTPVFGKGHGGAPANRQANCSFVFKKDNIYYGFATNGYGYNSDGEDRNVYLYKSTDGINFIDLGIILDKNIISAAGFGNTSIEYNKVNGKYEMLAEAFLGGIWRAFRFNSDSIESGWTFVNSLPSLQFIVGGMYGGFHHFYRNGIWHIFYHYGSTGGNLPTLIGYATSENLITATQKEMPVFGIESKPYGNSTDQIADPFVFESNGKSYMLAEYCKNTGGFASQIWMWSYDGTIDELLDL